MFDPIKSVEKTKLMFSSVERENTRDGKRERGRNELVARERRIFLLQMKTSKRYHL